MPPVGTHAPGMIGLPPTAGFVPKWFRLQGAAQAEQWTAVTSVVLSTLHDMGYFIPSVCAAFMKAEDRPESAQPLGGDRLDGDTENDDSSKDDDQE